MLTDSLASPRAKVERAKEHLRALEEAIAAFQGREPYAITGHRGPNGGDVFKVEIREPIPIEFGLVIADCVHNLHTALHYLVCGDVQRQQLPIQYGIGFPIGGSRKGFEANALRKLKCASKKARRLIYRLKPYKGANESFWMIYSLDNTDKHQALVPVWAGFPQARLVRESDGVRTTIASKGPTFPIKDGEVIFSDSLGDEPFDEPQVNKLYQELIEMLTSELGWSKVRVSATDCAVKFRLEMAFGEIEAVRGQPVVPTLHQLIEFTERVIDIFGRHVFN